MGVDEFFYLYFGLFSFVFGLCFGSFLSAVSYRIPHRLNWIVNDDNSPVRSRCPQCRHILSYRDLIPLLSWIFTFGRCRYCKSKVSVRYPLQEFFVGCFALGVYVLTESLVFSMVVCVLLLLIIIAGLYIWRVRG